MKIFDKLEEVEDKYIITINLKNLLSLSEAQASSKGKKLWNKEFIYNFSKQKEENTKDIKYLSSNSIHTSLYSLLKNIDQSYISIIEEEKLYINAFIQTSKKMSKGNIVLVLFSKNQIIKEISLNTVQGGDIFIKEESFSYSDYNKLTEMKLYFII